jgi:hypothetical protein
MTISHRILETLHGAMITHALYYYAVTSFDKPQALQEAVWSSAVGRLCIGIPFCVD